MTEPSDPEELQDLILETVGSPITTTSLYYALYALDEILDQDDAAYDLSVLEDRLYDGIYWYGVHAITNEMTNVGKYFYIDGEPLQELPEGEREDFIFRNTSNSLRDNLVHIPRMEEIPSSGIKPFIKRELRSVENAANAISEPDKYIRGLRQIFSIMPNRGKVARAEFQEGDTGWARGFGGPSWAAICGHLLNRNKSMKRIWVDQSFAIQHNTGTWLNKVSISDDERLRLVKNMSEDELFDIGAINDSRMEKVNSLTYEGTDRNIAIAQSMNPKFIQKHLLKRILDNNFNARDPSEMGLVFRFASIRNKEVGPDMVQWRRRLRRS